MGVDSYIFDEISKECFYFDRRSNLFIGPEDERASAILDKIHTIKSGRATSEEIAYVCDVVAAEWRNGDYRQDKATWADAIKKFATERPSGSFFTASDHDDRLSWDIKREDGYIEVGSH